MIIYSNDDSSVKSLTLKDGTIVYDIEVLTLGQLMEAKEKLLETSEPGFKTNSGSPAVPVLLAEIHTRIAEIKKDPSLSHLK